MRLVPRSARASLIGASADNQVVIDGAHVTSTDIDSSNGIIHGIDKVNVPTKQ